MAQKGKMIHKAAFLVLLVGALAMFGMTGEPAALLAATPSTPAVAAPAAQSPAGSLLQGAPKGSGNNLLPPTPQPLCRAGACFGDGTPCGDYGQGVCSQPPGQGCGICVF